MVSRKRTTRCCTAGGRAGPHREESMSKVPALVIAALLAGLAAATPALAQTTLTMSSWVSPQHHLTANVLQGWATEVEKATNSRVKFTMLPKHPSAPPGPFDAVPDGVVFPLESIISFKLDTVLEQATLFPGGMYSSSFGFFMNEDKWNKLPKQDQEAIEKISGEHIARLAGASWDEADRKGMEQLKKSGVKIVNADPEFVAEVRKRSAPIVEDWITKAKAKGVDAAKVLAEFREELKKVAAGK